MSTKPLTIKQFNDRFPDDDTCLDHLMRVRYGAKHHCRKCGAEARYYRVKGRRCFECEHCGFQVYPTVGTPFEKSRTSLHDWFYVMYLFCASRNGVAAKEVQRQLGVTYKTAWRMCYIIRSYMGYVDGHTPLGGPDGSPVEIDKAFIGGRDKRGHDDKAVVLGMVERKGEIVTRVVGSRNFWDVTPVLSKWIKPRSRIYSDSAKVFESTGVKYAQHAAVNHSANEWVRGEVHTNNIEAFWMHLKHSIKGTHIWVSKKHLQIYLREFEYRYNLRKRPELMFDLLLQAFPRAV